MDGRIGQGREPPWPGEGQELGTCMWSHHVIDDYAPAVEAMDDWTSLRIRSLHTDQSLSSDWPLSSVQVPRSRLSQEDVGSGT